MIASHRIALLAATAALVAAAVSPAVAQTPATAAAAPVAAGNLPADPWPRQVNLTTGTVLM